MKKYKIKSFSLIETIVSIGILSMIIISVLTIFDDFFKNETVFKNELKYENLIKKMNNLINEKYLNFIITKDIIELEISSIGGSKFLSPKIESFEILYRNEVLEPLYLEFDPVLMVKQEHFWGLSKKDLEEEPLKPYDIFVTQNIATLNGIAFPYKNVFIFKWDKLNQLKGFDYNVKNCLFSMNSQKDISYVSYSDLNLLNINGIDCETTINSFMTSNIGKLENKINGANEISYNYIKNSFKFTKIDNYKIVENKLRTTMQKFDRVVNNILDFSIRENKLLSTNNEVTIDHFVSCYFDSINSGNQCRISNYLNTEKINPNKVKFIFSDGIWIYKNDLNHIYNSAMKTTDLDNVIMTFLPRTGNNSHIVGLTNTTITGTTAESRNSLKEFAGIMDFNITGAVSIQMPSLEVLPPPWAYGNGFDKNNLEIALEKEGGDSLVIPLTFLPSTYKIFGTYDKSGLSTNGESEFLKIPFYFTNIKGSRIDGKNLINGTEFSKDFDLNVPIVKNINTKYETQNSGPFSSGLLVVFPWILDTNQSLIDSYNYGFYFKNISAIK